MSATSSRETLKRLVGGAPNAVVALMGKPKSCFRLTKWVTTTVFTRERNYPKPNGLQLTISFSLAFFGLRKKRMPLFEECQLSVVRTATPAIGNKE